jgi:hypothetical protein
MPWVRSGSDSNGICCLLSGSLAAGAPSCRVPRAPASLDGECSGDPAASFAEGDFDCSDGWDDVGFLYSFSLDGPLDLGLSSRAMPLIHGERDDLKTGDEIGASRGTTKPHAALTAARPSMSKRPKKRKGGYVLFKDGEKPAGGGSTGAQGAETAAHRQSLKALQKELLYRLMSSPKKKSCADQAVRPALNTGV